MPRFEFADPRELWQKYVLALLLIFVLITVSHFAPTIFGGDAVQSADDINTSGRQRMLSQRILFFATSYAKSGYEDTFAAEQLRAAADLFRTSHEALVSEEKRALPNAVRSVYFDYVDYENLDSHSLKYADAAIHLLLADDFLREDSYELLLSMGTEEFLIGLNSAVSAFEESARADARRAELASLIGYALAVLALIAEAFLIFRPAHKTISQAMEDLEENNEQLRQQEAEAFSALEDAEDAWMEAEMAKAASEKSTANNKAQFERVLQEIRDLFKSVEMAEQEVSRGPMSETQKMATQQVLRLQTLIQSVLSDFHKILDERPGDTEQDRANRTFNFADVAHSAAYAVKALDVTRKISVSVLKPEQADLPVSGDPISVLRLLILSLRHMIVLEGHDNISIDLRISVKEDSVQLGAILHSGPLEDGSSDVPSMTENRADLSSTFKEATHAALDHLGAAGELAHRDNGTTVLKLSWAAAPAAIRNIAKKRGRTRRRS